MFNLTCKYYDYFNKIKKNLNVLDFDDIEYKMLKLLKNEDFRQQLQNEYQYIFVDEFQDVNAIQGEIIRLVGNGHNLFLVGDVKQSIYGFRHADPEQFVSLFNQYQADTNTGVAEEMNINYRSNPTILHFVNQVFSKAMTEQSAGIDYEKHSMFEPMREDFQKREQVEIDILAPVSRSKTITKCLPIYSVMRDGKNAAKDSDTTRLANFVANKISGLRKQMRLIDFKDICILSRKLDSEHVRELVRVLQSQNIPISIDQNIMAQDCEGLQVLFGILRVAFYSVSDIDWATYLTSVGQMSFSELFDLAGQEGESLVDKAHNCTSTVLASKIKKALIQLDNMREDLLNKDITQAIELLLHKYQMYLYIANTTNGMQEIALIEDFLRNISEEEKAKTIVEYLLELYDQVDREQSITMADDENSVTIQTIHKSKGLEYPIVILIDCGAKFSQNILRKKIICDGQLGIGINYYNVGDRTVNKTINRLASELLILEKEAKEELRLLYVAMTRAQNQLYLIGTYTEEQKKNLGHDEPECYFDSILLPFKSTLESLYGEKIYCNIKDVPDEECQPQNTNIVQENVEQDFNDLVDFNLNFKYDDTKSKIIMKNNVTQVTKQLVAEAFDPQQLYLHEALTATAENTDIGIKYHQALEQMQLDREQTIQVFDALEIEGVDKSDLMACYDALQPLFEGAIHLDKEAQFMLNVPYCQIMPNSAITDCVLVQGVVDLIIEKEDGLIVVDYKYSGSTPNALQKRYSPQLNLYALACEKGKNKKVLAKYIYSIKSKQLIKVK